MSSSATTRDLTTKVANGKDNKPVPISKTVGAYLMKHKDEVLAALPKHMTPERMTRVCVTAIASNPQLLKCDMTSLVGCCVEASQLGLEFGALGHAYMIPYGKEAKFQMGYKGLIELIRRSGQVSTIAAAAVYKDDEFHYERGINESLTHVPALSSKEPQDKDIVAFYAYAKFKDGGFQFEVMSLGQVDSIRKRSKASKNGPWVTDYAEMGKKTVLKRLAKLMPMTVETAELIEKDTQIEFGSDIDTSTIDLGELPVEEPATEKTPEEIVAETKANAEGA